MNQNRKYAVGLGIFLLGYWIVYDFVILKSDEFKSTDQYSFEGKSLRDITGSMSDEATKMVSAKAEKDQIISFVHIIERNHYLLHNKEISLQSYYDFINNILYPKQKGNLKNKREYAYQVNKYLRRMKKTEFKYTGYQIGTPEFFYDDFARNSRVSLIRILRGNKSSGSRENKEPLEYSFRKYKNRYYLYLK
ncbi:MAG: hypothetical protein GY765_31560 [bacterium]|nr:hypothetical protein [bacterium]